MCVFNQINWKAIFFPLIAMDIEKAEHSVSFTKSTPLIGPQKSNQAQILPRNKSSPNVGLVQNTAATAGSHTKRRFAGSLDNIGLMRLMGSFTGLVDHDPDELTPLRGNPIL